LVYLQLPTYNTVNIGNTYETRIDNNRGDNNVNQKCGVYV